MDEGVQLVAGQKHSAKKDRGCCMLHGFTAYVT
jgi:hypothetical protein